MGSQGTILSGQKSSGGSPLFSMMNAYSQLSGGGKSDAGSTGTIPSGYDTQNPSQSQMPSISDPTFGSSIGNDSSSAIDRRAEAAGQHPDVHIAKALNYLDDPNNGMDFETRMSMAEPLLRAQHFGYGGGLDQTAYQKGSQGQIASGKIGDGGGLGKIASIAALA